jgi:hypothetical protein
MPTTVHDYLNTSIRELIRVAAAPAAAGLRRLVAVDDDGAASGTFAPSCGYALVLGK